MFPFINLFLLFFSENVKNRIDNFHSSRCSVGCAVITTNFKQLFSQLFNKFENKIINIKPYLNGYFTTATILSVD